MIKTATTSFCKSAIHAYAAHSSYLVILEWEVDDEVEMVRPFKNL